MGIGFEKKKKRQRRSHPLLFIFRNHVYVVDSSPFKSKSTFSSIPSANIDQAPTQLSILRPVKELETELTGLPASTLTVKQGRKK